MKLSILYPFNIGHNVSLLIEDEYHGGTEVSGDVADLTPTSVIIVSNGKSHAFEIVAWEDIYLFRINDHKKYGFEDVLDTDEMQSLKSLAENVSMITASDEALENCVAILESCGIDNPKEVLRSMLLELTQNDFDLRQHYENKDILSVKLADIKNNFAIERE